MKCTHPNININSLKHTQITHSKQISAVSDDIETNILNILIYILTLRRKQILACDQGSWMGIYNNIHLHQPQLKTTVPIFQP